MFTGQNPGQQLTQDIFIKDFYSDAYSSLRNGIKGGLVNPNDTTPLNNNEQPEKIPTTSSAPDPKQYKSLSQTPNAIRKREKRANKEPAGNPVPTTVGKQFKKNDSLSQNNKPINESANEMTIAEFLYSWYSQYMAGVNWQRGKPIIIKTLNQLQQAYPSNFKQYINQLAHLSYSLSKAGAHIPAGAKNANNQTQTISSGNTIAELISVLQDLKNVNQQAFFDRLKKIRLENPSLYNQVRKEIK